ncbi:MAG TPA: hypothetical protein PKI62_03860 [bacterium]|nr:hypothetical protein [bacterium]HPR86391.1 hypothetical protein [bacterium]
MGKTLKEWFEALGPFGKRGIIYTLAGLAGLIAHMVRGGMQQPFGIVIWLLITGIGLYYLFVLAGRRS